MQKSSGSAGAFLDAISRIPDDFIHSLRLRQHRNMTGSQLGDLGAHPLSEEALQFRLNGAVLGAHDVVGWFAFPRCSVAGAIANRTGDVVGLSNMFVPACDEEFFRAACVARVIDAFPGLPIVAYEPRRQLAQGPTLNFDALGPLRVWVRP